MRRLIALALLVGCASMAPIPGGPEDHTPPKIVRVTPDTNAVNFHGKAVDFRYDGVVSDLSGPTQDLNGLFVISPRDGTPRINWHRDHIDVRPHDHWRPNTAYRVTMLPGLADLSNNITKYTYSFVFSTGPTIPPFGILGRVFDWSAQHIAPNAIVEAIHRVDSTATQRADSLVYFDIADSTGQFQLGPLDSGTYTVVAFIDPNHNLRRDVGELWDSTVVHITTTQPYLEMLAAHRDTVGPSLVTVAETDSATIRLTFDKPLSPAAPLDRSQFRVVTGDSVPLTVASVLTLAAYQATVDRAKADSTARADSLALLSDTTKRRRPALPKPVAPPPAVDTSPSALKPSRPAPATDLVLQLAAGSTLKPLTQVRVTATDMVNLLGYKGTSVRVFATPKPAAPPDTSKVGVPHDTSGVPPPPKRTGGGGS
ncbi:MAG: Ig-like domain-containing protein [Gemmatimonadaceae bacterium]